jgi:hypothetical protein
MEYYKTTTTHNPHKEEKMALYQSYHKETHWSDREVGTKPEPLPRWCHYFEVVVGGLCGQMTLRAMPAVAQLLVGPPMLGRSKGMIQTKKDTLVLQFGGWARGWRPLTVKNISVSKPGIKPRMEGLD